MDTNLRRNRTLAVLIALAFFFAIAPTLPWQEFSSGPENLVIATSMEMRRGGPWLIPTLQGEPRLAKPPLAAWITAKSMWAMTISQIDILDPLIRDRAYSFLAIEARWPALLATCGILLGIFSLGRAIRDSSLGLIATAVGASSYFLLRFSHYATTDIYLALFVIWANVFLAQAVLRRRYWRGFLGAGIALGLAMMSKGPVSLVESAVPIALYAFLAKRTRLSPSPGTPDAAEIAGWKGWGEGRTSHLKIAQLASERLSPHPNPLPAYRARGQERGQYRIPLLLGFILFLAIGLWWFALVFSRFSNVTHRWFSEVTRIGATDTPPGPILTYLSIIFLVLPWTIFFLVGLTIILRDWRRRGIDPDVLPALLVFVPLILMTFAKDRQDRYALPMIAPAAVVVAIGVMEHLRAWKHPGRADFIALTLHWLTLATIAIALPNWMRTQHWLLIPLWRFVPLEFMLALLIWIGIRMHRRNPAGLVSMTFVTMLVAQAVIFEGYCHSPNSRSDMKPLAELVAARYPDGLFFNAHPKGKRPPTDLGVYLNRTIHWTANPDTLTPGPHPLILFIPQNKNDPDPIPPQGWEFVSKTPHDKDSLWTFVLPPP